MVTIGIDCTTMPSHRGSKGESGSTRLNLELDTDGGLLAEIWWRTCAASVILLFGLLTTIALLVASTIAVRVFRGLLLIMVEWRALLVRARRYGGGV